MEALWFPRLWGEGKPEKARELFSLFIYSTAVCGIIIAVISFLFLRSLAALMGAAAATAVSQMLGGFIPILFFCRADAGTLRLTKAKIDGKALLKACMNGSSELMSNISMSIVSILYNFQLMRYAG